VPECDVEERNSNLGLAALKENKEARQRTCLRTSFVAGLPDYEEFESNAVRIGTALCDYALLRDKSAIPLWWHWEDVTFLLDCPIFSTSFHCYLARL